MKIAILVSIFLAAATSSAMAMPQITDNLLQNCKKCWDDCAYRRTGAVARRRFTGVSQDLQSLLLNDPPPPPPPPPSFSSSPSPPLSPLPASRVCPSQTCKVVLRNGFRRLQLAAAAGEPPCTCAQDGCPSALETAQQLERNRGRPRVYKPQPHGTEELIQGPR